MGWAYRLPEAGERVGDYRIVGKLGHGSYGHVYKAEQAGQFYAVKLLRGRLLQDRARREIRILLHLEHPGVVRFVACGYWPDPTIGHPYIVMELAEGRTLEAYAQEENPSARRAARIVLDTALTLGEVLRQGAMHRDLKPDNIIIRDVNARPLLIDFGVGTLAGAPAVTSSGLPPGTLEFRAPEAWRFSRENDSARYDYGPADELWALGVTFYWLLTDILPFGDREDEEGGGLVERILHQTPVAPHVLNPRVPRVLSDISMRMLEKEPAARYASVMEFCAALDEALAGADASWDSPLIEPDAPHTRTTEEDPARVDANDAMRWLRRWQKEKRRRGRKPPEKAPAPALPVEAAPAQVAPPVPAAPPAPEAPASESHDGVARAEPPPSAVPAPLPVTGRFPGGVGMLPVRAMALDLLKRPALLAGLAAVLVAGASLGLKRLHTSSQVATTRQAESGHEVARPAEPQDPPGGEGAEPGMGSISAPEMLTMQPKDDSSGKTQERKTKVRGSAGKALGTAAVCAALAGCPAPPRHVRPTPEPQSCPDGAVETMKMLGIVIDEPVDAIASLRDPDLGASFITVREGETTLYLIGGAGKLPDNTLLFGRLLFGDGRVYGRLTEAKVPGGETFKVCMEVWDEQGGRGAIREPDGEPENARVFSTVEVRAVSSFK